MILASQCAIVRNGKRSIAWLSPAMELEKAGTVTFAEDQEIPSDVLRHHRKLKGADLEWPDGSAKTSDPDPGRLDTQDKAEESAKVHEAEEENTSMVTLPPPSRRAKKRRAKNGDEENA